MFTSGVLYVQKSCLGFVHVVGLGFFCGKCCGEQMVCWLSAS